MNKKHLPLALILLLACVNAFPQETGKGKTLKKIVEILASDSLEGRGFRCSSKSLTIDFLKNEFQAAGFKPLNGNYEQKFMNYEYLTATEGTNIMGIIEGTDSVLKNEYVVIGAHYDHLGWKMNDSVKVVYNGADDNASGVATMIETGKKLLEIRNQLKRSVLLIAFDGEEAGLIGSAEFLKAKIVPDSAMKAMFSLDMVGMLKKNGGLNIAGMNLLQNGEELFAAPLGRTSINLKRSLHSVSKRTDTKSFAEKGIPSVHFTTGTVSPYHKPEDDSDSLDYEGMEKLSGLLTDFTVVLSNETSLVATNSLKPAEEHVVGKSGIRFGYNLGMGSNFHNYNSTFFNGKPLFAFEAGLNSQWRLKKDLVVEAEVNYEFLGSESPYGKTRAHAVTPALDLLLTTKETDEKIFFFGLIGGFYRCNFAGSLSNNANFSNAYYQHETGIKYGIGFQFDGIQIKYLGKLGLTNIDKSRSNGDVYNAGTYFSIVKFF